MKVYRDIKEISKEINNTYIALGNFDGVHLGHKHLIEKCKNLASEKNTKSVVLTFEPHPQVLFKKRNFQGLITPKKLKESILKEIDVDYLVFLPFSFKMANLSPLQFVRDILVKNFRPKGVIIGFNYSFGKKGLGKKEDLRELAAKYKFSLDVVPPVYIDNHVVSSSYIRNILKEGNIKKASKYLGYFPYLIGQVVSGEKRGRQMGYPTANLFLEKHSLLPKKGVYASKITINEKEYMSITNIGNTPTFGKNPTTIETHILDFSQNLYDQEVRLQLIERIREEKKFASQKELASQINEDVKRVKAILS